MRTANLAIVFTEIAGFSERTSRQTLEQNQRLLQLYTGLLTPLFRAFGGRVVKSIGESFLVTFDSPTQAVLCGVAAQDRLWEHNRTAPEPEQLAVRVAINLGEVRLESGDIFGEPVNIAARVEALAPPSEVYFTEALYLAMNKAEVPAEEVGAFELKGIPGRIRVFRVPRLPATPGAAAGGDAPPFGNFGLARLPELERASFQLLSGVTGLVRKLGQMVARTVRRAVTAFSQAPARRQRQIALAAATLLVAVVGDTIVWIVSRSDVDVAIEEVARAPDGEKRAKIKIARQLIADEKSAPEAAYDMGKLEEVLANPAHAIPFYESAARAGHDRAASRLIELLSHPTCSVRRDAARVLGELKLERSRGALETLAKRGGPGEDDRPFIGCDSRKAAEEALRRME